MFIMTENIFLTSIEPIYCDQETFEDAKKGNKSRKLKKDRQYNGQMKNDKQ
jgi:hypothetical protein